MNTENNILLAEFIGYKKMHPKNESLYNKSKNHELYIEDSKYHSDWNWLMEVVEKIEALRDGRCLMDNDDILAYVTIGSQYCEIRVYECIFEPETEFPTKIQAVYDCCVQFVKWYNSKQELQC